MVKIGRTHLEDAVPLTVGQEWSGYVGALDDAIAEAERVTSGLLELAMGGTAVGTGLNAPAGFGEQVAAQIASMTGVPYVTAANKFTAQGTLDRMVRAHGGLKTTAVTLFKIANDLRWLGSGPRTGIHELLFPENEPGSSIMPGKVNPTQAEAMLMVAIQVIASDVAVSMGGAEGNFELNAFRPILIANYLHSALIMADMCDHFRRFMVEGTKLNQAKLKENIDRSVMMVTALSPVIGYDKAAEISYYAIDHDLTLKEAALAKGVSEELYDKIVDPPQPHPPRHRRPAVRPAEVLTWPPRTPRPTGRLTHMEPIGKAAFIASVGGTRGYADWTDPDHRLRRLLSEFIGMAGLTFILSGGAAILARYGGRALQPWQTVLVLSLVSALWLVVAVYFLGDISAHFNPATTLAFALRKDMDWMMAGRLLGRPVRGRRLRVAAGPRVLRPGGPPGRHDAQAWPVVAGGRVRGHHHVRPGADDLEHGQRAEAQRAVRPAGRGRLHPGLGHHGRPVRGRLHEPGPQLRTRRGHRPPVHLVGLPDRPGGRRGDRRRRGASSARAGQGPGSRRRPGHAARPDRVRDRRQRAGSDR